jgi:ElaB/YqjD/DUF883 family membrane-anchored ribosome-binding protein
MSPKVSPSGEPTKERVDALQADAAKMLDDLSSLSAKLKEVGKAKAEELGGEAITQLNDQLKILQEKLGTLSKDSEQLLAQVDKSVKAHPYVYIAGALGLGIILGKALRS